MRSFARVKWWKLTRILPARLKGEYNVRYKIALLILGVTILAASIAGCISYQSVRRLIVNKSERNALLEVKERGNKIDRWIGTKKTELETLANTPPVRSMNWSVAGPYLKSEVNRLQDFKHFALIEPDGSYFTTKVGRALINVSDRQHFKKAMAGEVYVSDPTISRTLKKQSIVPISAPVWSNSLENQSKKPIGVMNGVISIERIAEVAGKLEYGVGTYAFVLNSQGVPIVHPDARLMGNIDKTAPSLLESADTNLANVTREMVYQKTGIVLTQINDARVYVAYLPLQQAEWSIALVIPCDNLEKELFALNILAAAATGLFAAAILAVIVALKLFSQKCIRTRTEALIHRLTGRIRASLELDRILQTTVDELGTLLKLDRAIFGWYDPRQDTVEFCWEYCREGLPGRLGIFGATGGPSGDLAARLHRCETILLKKTSAPDATESQEVAHLELTDSHYAVVPVLTQTNRLGYLFASANRRFATPEEVEVLETIADSLAIAISQSQLHGQIQEELKLLEEVLAQLRRTEEHLVQSEKMTIVGQLAAGIAQEINNPINFIYGRLIHVNDSLNDLLNILRLYREQYPTPVPRIAKEIESFDLDFISEDLPQILNSLKIGTDRIRQSVLALRNISLPDEANKERANLHESIDNILLLLAHRLDKKILVVKEYSNLPPILCYPGQLSQVFANILSKAIDAVNRIDKFDQTITIKTDIVEHSTGRFIAVSIAHNGSRIPPEIQDRIFDPFYHTKSLKNFTGLGLSVCYKIIVDLHGGRLTVQSPVPSQIESQTLSQTEGGAEFIVELPIV
ncbi:MAG: GAF domain-containing protein [Microcoleus sp. PH2017_10_PVI_O_A]|nr:MULTISPECIES: cache domain-containing protein [unclassified Microcoleus]MCC3407766.1 GAF domain-containing protein [Microcoleus sp. PH2017_10_PVI_O_A]MCC3461932.1 GAF domain-containing protein [Microcoleus sp. PH2017_11_PCY_U_A]MCC3480396.1 GAF domain-containing protein [Microcoleus sp. PH2017_12_PCY_D_A]MCC3530089.1 GAF domain-containing protein [Microcoleus sp. PH2017_21_RUC_O_A]TAE80062.1 MAG: GAF domain-containing protein [Oscillatoriales cyanobacterium]